MSSTTCSEPVIPRLDSLGDDLLATTRSQRRVALARPFMGLAAYGLASYAHLWWLTPFLVFLIFVAVVTVTHDVVHGSLGLSRRQTEWALFATGAILLESGHAYRATHLRHHRVFPGPDDPEGDPARLTLIRAILCGPFFLPRLWCWAFAQSRSGSPQRIWLVAEAAWALAVIVTGVMTIPADSGCSAVRGVGGRRQLGLPTSDSAPAAPPLWRHAVDSDPHVARTDHPRPVSRADLPPGTPSVSRSAESQLTEALSPARWRAAAGRRPAPARSVICEAVPGRRGSVRAGIGHRGSAGASPSQNLGR